MPTPATVGTMSSQILWPLFLLVLFVFHVSGQKENDVRLVDGPNDYEGRPEIFRSGVWLSLCRSFTNYYVPGTICKQLGYQSDGALTYYAGAYGRAPGEIFGQRINCYSSSSNISQCNMYNQDRNCDPQYTLGVSCNASTSRTKIRLQGGRTQYEGRIEVFQNGVWGTVCRTYYSHSTYIYNDINAHIACRELFGTGYGGTYYPTHETPSRFGIRQYGAIHMRYVRCNGDENSFLECQYDSGGSDSGCNHEKDATVKCFRVPNGCVGYYTTTRGTVKSPGYPAGYRFTKDTVCVWKIEVTSARNLNLSFTAIDAHNQTDQSSLVQVSSSPYNVLRTSYGSFIPDLSFQNNYAFIRHKSKAGTFGVDFSASWSSQECRFSYTNQWASGYSIQSPGYNNGHYPPGVDCYYYVEFRHTLVARVEFFHLNVDDKSGGACQDYIEVFDGPTASHSSLGRFCGSSYQAPLTLSQNTVFLHFHSDNIDRNSSRGVYVSVYGRGPERVINVTGSSGVIRSPGYPNLYAEEMDYKWLIKPLPYQSITLVVSNYTSTSCNYEESLQVEFYNDRRYTTQYLYCRRTSAAIVSNGNPMTVWFRSVHNISTGHAFQANWTAECRRNFTGTSGTIMSPESPSSYPANLDCVYIITLETGYYINLTFTSFNLDSGNPCNDYVQVRDGISEDFPLRVNNSCGSSPPPMVRSSSNSLLIHFHSDSVSRSASTGFVATYTSAIKDCASKKMTLPSDHFASPGYPVQHARYTHCVWKITVPQGTVRLTFQDFAVGQKNTYGCSGAYVRVYDSDDVDADTVIDTLCGSVAVPKLTSTGRSMTVSLYSFGSLPSSAIGFQAFYASVQGSQSEQYELFPYGTWEQDEELQQSDYATGKVTMQLGIPFKNKIEHEVYIGNNGLVSIGKPYAWPDLPETGKVICVYCAYIDNSDSVGGIYYHQYSSGEPADSTVVEKASREVVEFSQENDFNASSVLVVTWDRVRQGRYRTVNYDPLEDSGEATFQLALISDGVTTYALVYYKLGGMAWTYRGSWSYVIIGFSSGDREDYRQNFYTRTERAYRIDGVPGNTGRLGMWFYKIGTVSGTPESTCTTWFRRNIQSEPVRRLFFSRLPECPCSHRDVWQKTRYLWVKARTDTVNKIECYRMNRASSNRFYPVGKECCYSLDTSNQNYEQLITSRPYAGTALAYNPSYYHLREKYRTEDKLAHDSCCNLSKPAYCQFYYLLRPIGNCRSNIPFRFTWIFGDPHIVTLDEREYTFNGWGEYTLATLTSLDSDFVLQGRTAPTVTDRGSAVNATVFTAFGAEENGTRVFVQLDPNTNNSLIIYAAGTDYTRQFYDKGDDFIVDEDDFTLMRDNNSVAVIFPSEIGFSVSIGWRSLVLGVFMPEKFRNQTKGLLGNYNTNKTDEFVLPNGRVLSNTLTDREIHYQFGNAWAVTAANSVLRYGPREGPSDYLHTDFKPIFLDEISSSQRQAAQRVCSASDAACIYDYVASGSQQFALKTKESRQEALKENAAAKNRLPSLQVPDNETVTVNVPKRFRVTAYDPGDTVTYKLTNSGNGALAINSATGDITVTVNAREPITLQVYAVDSFNAQSEVRTIPLIVCYGCGGHGQCNFTRAQPSVGNINFQHAACDCSTGWAGANCSEDYDACSTSPCHPLQTCTDKTPAQQGSSLTGYTCSACPAGYQSPTGQTNVCLDVDECEDDALNECQVTCNNTAGSYRCSCPDGYRLTGDLRSCADVNECAEKSHDCQQVCNNTEGGYTCLCQEGYSLDSSGRCVQSSSTQNICRSSGCSHGCKAVRDPATSAIVARCFCHPGYDLNPANNKSCVDHNECQDNVCSQNCSNMEGSFNCSCYSGFQLNSDQRTCSPCPSLQYGPQCAFTCVCSGRGLDCHSVTGCVCQKGWTGSQCQDDIDECEENPDVCGEGQVCTNTNGSYTCTCQEGYAVDATGVCQDVDECRSDATCGEHALCTNVPGSFQCSCVAGYQKTNGTCKDIDECALSQDNCQQKCVNVGGTYNCECNYGYRLNTDRTTCSQLLDPCAEEENLLCAHGCTLNDRDRAECFCRSGYRLGSNNQSCSDVNECLDSSTKCSHTCTNTVGGFTCSCPAGMTLDNDGKTCVACPTGTYGTNCSRSCSCGAGASRCDAVTGCVCKTGWTGSRCQNDVNECDVSSNRRQCAVKGATCVNLQGGYRCQCATGYKADDSGVCQDIDECTTSPCGQICENSAGSYRCLCNAGFTLNSTTGECADIDECAEPSTHSCTQQCDNTAGSYRCSCNVQGYVLNDDGLTCRGTTTCTRKTCDTTNGGCYLKNGVESCFCNTGYTLGRDGVTCSTSAQQTSCDNVPSDSNACRTGYRETSTGSCVAVSTFGFTARVNVGIAASVLTQEPSRSTLRREGEELLENALRPYLPNLLAVSIHNIRQGSVVADVDVEVASRSGQVSASSLAVALVNMTGLSVTVGGQTGTVGFTVDGLQVLTSTTFCDVFSRFVTCNEDQVCKLNSGRPQCRSDGEESSSGGDQAACWESPVNRHCLHLCCDLLPS